MEIKFTNTTIGESYWDKTGAYQSEYEELYHKYVPHRGEADTEIGKALRAVSNLYYEYYNNGNGNARGVEFEEEANWVECDNCCGSGSYFDDFLDEEITCPCCGGEGGHWEDKEEYFVEETYENYLSFLTTIFSDNNDVIRVIEDVRNIICQIGMKREYCEEVYNMLVDYVLFWAINQFENKVTE